MNKQFFQLIVILSLIAVLTGANAQESKENAILGVWLNEPGDGLIRIEKSGDSFIGVIQGSPDPTGSDRQSKDVNNPDPTLRDRPLIGLQMMGEYRFDGKRWSGGWIYDPDNGKRYKSRLTLQKNGTLEVRGYVGSPLFGRTQVWTRHTP